MKDEEWEVLDKKALGTMVVPRFISGFQYFERRNNRGCDFGHVLLGDDEPCQKVGKGKVRIKLNNGNQWLLKM